MGRRAIGRWTILGALACAQLALVAPAAHAEFVWHPPAVVSAPGPDGQDPRVVVDAAGNATAVWARSIGEDIVVQSATRPAGGAWQPPVDLSPRGQHAYAPAIAVGVDGELLAVWQATGGVHVASRSPTGAWGPIVVVAPDGGNRDRPALAVDARGGAIVVWDERTIAGGFGYFAGSAVHAVERLPDGSWQAPTKLSGAEVVADEPDVAVDPAGNAVAVWTQRSPSTYGYGRITAAVRRADGSWRPPVELSANSWQVAARVAMDSQGAATVVWTQHFGHGLAGGDSHPFGVLSSELKPDGTWQGPVWLTTPFTGASDPLLAVDGSGTALAVWRGGVSAASSSSYSITASTRRVGEGWTTTTVADHTDLGESENRELAVAANGDAIVVWRQRAPYPDPGIRIQASVRRAGSGWQPAVAMSDPLAQVSSPHVAMGPGGEAIAVWRSWDAVSVVVQSATFGPAPPPPAAPDDPPPPPPPAPAITGLRLSHVAFRAARSGAAVRTPGRAGGSTVSYTLTGPARVRFTVQLVRDGRRAGRNCAAPTRRNRVAARCERLAAVRGGFTRIRPEGADRFTFSGRVGGRTLRAGAYRLVATPAAAGRAGVARHVRMRILAPRR